MVPLKRTGSCRMMDRRERRVCSGSLEMSMPSMMIRPVCRQCHRWGTRERGDDGAGDRVCLGPGSQQGCRGRQRWLGLLRLLSKPRTEIPSGGCGMPVIQLTFEHVHHAEEGEREGGLPTACAAADANLEGEEQPHCGHWGSWEL